MTQYRSVNETLDQLDELNGQPAEIEGILAVESEGYHLLHYPKAERRSNNNESPIHESSFWLAFGSGSITPNQSALRSWEGKRVRVHGLVYSAKSLPVVKAFEGQGGGFGPWGFWRAQVEPYSVQRVTSEQRKEDDA